MFRDNLTRISQLQFAVAIRQLVQFSVRSCFALILGYPENLFFTSKIKICKKSRDCKCSVYCLAKNQTDFYQDFIISPCPGFTLSKEIADFQIWNCLHRSFSQLFMVKYIYYMLSSMFKIFRGRMNRHTAIHQNLLKMESSSVVDIQTQNSLFFFFFNCTYSNG